MIRADQFEPQKLIAVTERLRRWCDGYSIGDSGQVFEDIKWLLASHLDYYQRYEKWERAYWWQQDTEDNGNIAISWRERAEELEALAKRLTKSLEYQCGICSGENEPGSKEINESFDTLNAAKEVLNG